MFAKKLSPYSLVLLSFLTVILVGTLLLVLPISHENGQWADWLDSFFLATSATCVTGLSPYASLADELTIFGEVVIMILMSIGGLGVIAIFTFVIIVTGRRIGIMDRYIIKEALNLATIGGAVRFVKRMIYITLIVELIGMIPYLFVFIPEKGIVEGIYQSMFLSISAFNNAGFDLLGSTSLRAYSGNWIINITTMLLIFFGGLGFIVISELLTFKKPEKWSVYTKIVLTTSLSLIVFGGTLLFLIEIFNPQGALTILQALFQSVSSRTAGLATANLNQLTFASKVLVMSLMFIGANPISTGGGIKTTTAFIILVAIAAFLRERKPHAFRRSFSDETVLRSMILFIASFVLLVIASVVIERFESYQNLTTPIPYLFEVISAFGTVGFSLGITPTLSGGSQVVLSLLMFFGRVGPISILSVASDISGKSENADIEYIEEVVPIG